MEVGPCVSLKVATKAFLVEKNLLKLRFLDYVSEAKMEEYHQKTWNVSDKCRINATCLALYHLKVVTPVTMKGATKASLRSKKL